MEARSRNKTLKTLKPPRTEHVPDFDCVFHMEACLVQHPHAITCKPIQALANKGRKQQELLQGHGQPEERIFTEAVLIIKKTTCNGGLTVDILVSLPQLYLSHTN